MPVNAITNGAVQVTVDITRVMHEAAACADSNGSVTINSGNIKTGAQLAMHKCIDAYGDGGLEFEKGMAMFACQRYTEYDQYLWY